MPPPHKKCRLDQLLVERGLCESRTKAVALILAGHVVVGENRQDKPGTQVSIDVRIRLKQPDHSYVSRGGVKLAGALDDFAISVDGLIALDVGASTGGFTDCLLQRGAAKVYALDVGRGQLHTTLLRDPRVILFEKKNVRTLEPCDLPELVDLAVMDLSFISLRLALVPVVNCLIPRGQIVALVKPQFELGKGQVGKGGIVRDEALQKSAVAGIVAFAQSLNLAVDGQAISKLPGADGNVEYFLRLTRV
jgi:23S rRNA (cytidine1920-2'-O)/16S rRNA (cytidine1409-2'-O)-methyltransferase